MNKLFFTGEKQVARSCKTCRYAAILSLKYYCLHLVLSNLLCKFKKS